MDTREVARAEALVAEPRETLLVRRAAADRADVSGVASQRADERRMIELRAVREDHDRGARAEPNPRERLLRPHQEDLVGEREALSIGECGARIRDDHAIADALGERRERLPDMGRADDDHERRRREGLKEDGGLAAVSEGRDHHAVLPTAERSEGVDLERRELLGPTLGAIV